MSVMPVASKTSALARAPSSSVVAEALALQVEAGDQAVDGGGEHLLVGDTGVDGVAPGERDAVAAEDGDGTSGRLHVHILSGEVPRANRMRGTSRNVDSELHTELHVPVRRTPKGPVP